MNATEMHDPADSESPPRNLRRDLGGLALFALAIFLGVSAVMAARKPDPLAGGTTALVTGLVGWLGVWPLIVLSACLGLLGARLWIAGAVEHLARNAAWSALLALAFALLFGAASAGSGGSFGEFTGGNLSGLVTAWAAVPAALVVVAGVLWFGWLRPPDWQPVVSPEEPAPSIYTPTDSEGLTADEAEALLPEQITGRSIRVAPELPPPYPPDVRRDGLIPEGARALEPRDEPAPRTPPDAPAQPALADAAARIPVEPLAQPARGLAHQAAALSVQPAAQPLAAPLGGSALEDLATAVPRWERPRDVAPVAPESAPAAAAAPAAPAGAGFHISAAPVRSAWETEDEEGFEDEDDEQEVVAVTASAVAVELDEEVDEDSEEVEQGLFEDETTPDEDELAEEDDSDTEVLAAEDDDEAWDDDEDAEVLVAATEDEPPLAADRELSSVGESAAADSLGLQRPGWEQGGLFDDEPVDAYGTPMTLVDALRQANQETSARLDGVAADSDIDTVAAAEADAPTLEVTAPAAEAPADVPADVVEPEPTAAQADVPTPEPEIEVEVEVEVELELQPKPRAAKPKAPKPAKEPKPTADPAPAVTLEGGDDLVFRAGMLFLERGRVAVSMLQRTFDLDFKEATALLDQLQNAGLIGPYLGGQKRDLLLTADEWRQRRVLAR